MPVPVPSATTSPPPPFITQPVKTLTTTTHTTASNPSLGSSLRQAAPHLSSISPAMIGGVAVFIALMLIVILIVYKKIAGPQLVVDARKLNEALTSPTTDAVGLILDLDTNVARVVPLRRVENLYVGLDGSMVNITITVPNAPTWSIRGKPLIIAVGSGNMAMQVDPVLLTKLGLAKIAFEDQKDLWDDTSDPRKAYEKLVERLSSMTEKKMGTVHVTPNRKISFMMSPPRIVLALLRNALANSNILANIIVSFAQTVDFLAKAISRDKAKEYMARSRLIWTILMGIGMVIIIVVIAMVLFKAGGGGR